MIISKSFEFDAAHRLNLPYESKCTNIHGHRYKVIVSLKSNSVNDVGMITDFSELKKLVTVKIINKFDHKTILNECSISNKGLIEAIEKYCGEDSIIKMQNNPTAENMAKLFFRTLFKDCGDILHKVEVYETPTSRSCYP